MTKLNLLLSSLLFFSLNTYAQLFPNGDFEQGTTAGCHCPNGFFCDNDAGRVVDGIHPVYKPGDLGCVVNSTTNTANSLGAHSGTGYVYFYAGADAITSPIVNFSTDTKVELCLWYSGPQGSGSSGQNTSKSHFSFGLNGGQVGPDVEVRVNTKWTEYRLVIDVPAGNHRFNILSGGAAQYAIWFDDFSVKPVLDCELPEIDLVSDTTLCQGQSLLLDVTSSNTTYLWQDNSTLPTFNVTTQGNYSVEVTNSCGTTNADVTVNYQSLPNINLGSDTTLCSTEVLQLNSVLNSADTWLWQDGSNSSSFLVDKPGIFWLEGSNDCGISRDSINIQHILSTIDLGQDTTLCENETLQLDATSPNTTYLWQDNSTNPTFTVNQSGEYIVTTLTNNCTFNDTILVEYKALPKIELGMDTTLCENETLQLDATSPNTTYLWQDNSTNPTFTVNQKGVYFVTGYNNCGNTSDSINVFYNPLPTVNLGNDTTLCENESLLLDLSLNNADYRWQDNSSNSSFTVNEIGTYVVEVTINGCSTEDEIQIDYQTIPPINFGNQAICPKNSITLDATTFNATYLWQDNSTDPIFFLSQEGTYSVQRTIDNCVSNDTISVTFTDCESTLHLPNFFTPNGDGINDTFVPIESDGVLEMTTVIFSRWGKEIFETKNRMIEWNALNIPDGTYFWIVTYNTNSESQKSLTGYVTVIRD